MLLLALALAVAPSPQIEPPTHTVNTMRVVYAEPMANTMYVELNDRSVWRLRPCKFEDSRTCFWNAGTRGNTRGRSFVDIRGTLIYTNRI